MFRPGEDASPHVARVLRERALDGRAYLGVAFYEARRDLADEIAQQVVRDHQLPVDFRAGADAVHQQPDPLPDECRGFGWNRFEEHRECAGALERLVIAAESPTRIMSTPARSANVAVG